MNKTEKTKFYYSTVIWLVEDKEHSNRQYKWSKRELDHIKLGLSLMQEGQRAAFRERFKDYQIIKALDGDMKRYADESCEPAGDGIRSENPAGKGAPNNDRH